MIQLTARATIVGTPPLTEIHIPAEPYITVFDMAQDHNNVIYLTNDKGLQVFDGNRWHTVLIPDTILTRELLVDEDGTVYAGGYDFFGRVERNALGQYVFIDLTPDNNPIKFASIWEIINCQGLIYFRALNHVFQYAPQTGNINSWSFEGRLGDIICYAGEVWLQDRTEGMKVLQDGVWADSPIQLQDNSLIYDLQTLDDGRVFIHSQSDNWRVINGHEVETIAFDTPLPPLGSFANSLTLSDNQVVMGGKDGALTFLNFNDFTAQSFQLSNDWISAIIRANDGGLLILSNFTIYHLTWPSPWRIQNRDAGLSSDIFDLAVWNDHLYATSRAGVYMEVSQQQTGQGKNFKTLDWTHQEAWNLLPLNDEEMLLAESHRAYLIKTDQSKQALTDVIYPRVFQPSKFHPDRIYLHTELDTRLLSQQGEQWHDWVVAPGKPRNVIELTPDTLLITTVEGRFFKVILNDTLDAVEATVEMHNQAGIPASETAKLTLYEGPNQRIFGQTENAYYEFADNQLASSDMLGLGALLPPDQLSNMGLSPTGQFWVSSSDHIYLLDEQQWLTIDASEHIQGGIYAVEFMADQIKIAANSVILSYLLNHPHDQAPVSGKMLITAASLTPKDGSGPVAFPVSGSTPFTIGADVGGLTIQYSFTDIKHQTATQYQYRLVGHNNQWSPYSHNTQASFLELPAGDYAFEVRAKDVNGQDHSSPQLIFTVEPHWYLTPLAKTAWFIATLLLLWLLLRVYLWWRERKHEEQKRALKAIINEKTQALKLANEALQDLAHKDPLTGLSNRLFLDQYINDLIDGQVEQLAVIMMDMDHFKRYNDTQGHLAGDQLLEKFAQSLLTRIKRKQDLVARYGGEEFLMIMPKTDQQHTLMAAENIRSHTENQPEKTTVSIGVAFANSQPIQSAKDVFALIDLADKALYEAKTTGRNQVVVYNEKLEVTT
ncbi:ligand-binding sensor domain-containing diguanylate cyclase [Marinicella meishanensis]|uniref:ligand-binding sensor domain-containing diguanylate cyclase n=1 Tax=Marinicella meishanensis TaxID=2873263 RepID=UPI001CBB5E6F|nr:diguanylate cyclase [Marinicella sp. NBU2979]